LKFNKCSLKKKEKISSRKIGIGVSAKADEKNIGIVSALKNRYRSIPNQKVQQQMGPQKAEVRTGQAGQDTDGESPK
jgi:hypothetical protein